MQLGRLGVWSSGLRAVEDPDVLDAAAELEQLGYSALWFPAGRGVRAFEIGRALLAATDKAVIASGIVSIWDTTPEQADEGFSALEVQSAGRFLLGIGVSHGPLVDRNGPPRYRRPLSAMRDYLDALPSVPQDRRIVGALGPKMVELAVSASLGTHPYLVTPAMTAALRAAATQAVIAPEQAVVVDSDPDRARGIARKFLAMYLQLPNYVNNWLRAGYSQDDVANGGSDRLVDDLVAWGDPDVIAKRVGAYFEAGADHVCLQVLGTGDRLPRAEWRTLSGI